jgi:hypothetical protein
MIVLSGHMKTFGFLRPVVSLSVFEETSLFSNRYWIVVNQKFYTYCNLNLIWCYIYILASKSFHSDLSKEDVSDISWIGHLVARRLCQPVVLDEMKSHHIITSGQDHEWAVLAVMLASTVYGDDQDRIIPPSYWYAYHTLLHTEHIYEQHIRNMILILRISICAHLTVLIGYMPGPSFERGCKCKCKWSTTTLSSLYVVVLVGRSRK